MSQHNEEAGSDGVKRFIASLLCRATAPTTTSGPFFVSEPRMPELTAGAWAFRRSVPTEIERIVLEGLKKHVPFKKPISKHKRGLLSETPFFVRHVSVRQKTFRRLCPVLETPGFVVSEPLAGTPFRRRRLDIENFVGLAGIVGRNGWFATSLLPTILPDRALLTEIQFWRFLPKCPCASLRALRE